MPTLAEQAMKSQELLSLIKTLGLGAALGAPVGALMYGARDMMSPEPRIPSSTTFTGMPLISKAGPVREDEEEPVKKAATGAIPVGATAAPVSDVAKYITALLGGSIGLGAGYGLTGHAIESNRAGGIENELAEKQQLFDQLLLEEQMRSAGMKKADVLDTTLDTIFDHEFEKQSAGAANTVDDISAMLPVLLAIFGGGYGLQKGWQNTTVADQNRATAASLRESLDQRLMGNPEGPRAPMVVKVRTDRVGASPIAAGAGKSGSGMDALSRL